MTALGCSESTDCAGLQLSDEQVTDILNEYDGDGSGYSATSRTPSILALSISSVVLLTLPPPASFSLCSSLTLFASGRVPDSPGLYVCLIACCLV